jgi:hypothetical protein
MSFRPNVHDELTLNGVTYRIAEHLAAPGWIFESTAKTHHGAHRAHRACKVHE